MKVGIAIITKDRQEILNIAVSQHLLHSMFDKMVIIDDQSQEAIYNPVNRLFVNNVEVVRPPEWLGVAGARNYGLSLIDDCDVMFVMDDDVFPKEDGCIEAYLEAFDRNPDLHMLGAVPNEWGEVQNVFDSFVSTAKSTGVIFAITTHGLKTIGGFDGFGAKYGFDDADYFQRAHAAGLAPERYCTIIDFERYFHISDIDGDFKGFKWSGKSALGDDKFKEMEISGPNHFWKDSQVIFKPYK